MRYLLIFALFFFSLPTLAQRSLHELQQGDISREYTLYLPLDYDESQATPVVIVLHGATMSMSSMTGAINLRRQANELGFIIVYPQGVDGYWNYASSPDAPDDIEFLRALIADLQAHYNIDESRIFLSGYSNGGVMALHAACVLSEQITGVAVMSANYSTISLEPCANSTPMPVMMLLSTTDSAFPWEGYYPYVLSAQQTLTFLYDTFGCEGEATVADISEEDSVYPVAKLAIDTCEGRGSFTFYRVGDAPHYPLPTIIKVILADGSSGRMTDLFWEFFSTQGRESD